MKEQAELLSEESFIKRLFSWKFTAPLVLVQSVLLYLFLTVPSNIASSLGFIILGVIYFISKIVSTNENKEVVSKRQYASFFTYMLITVALGTLIYVATAKEVVQKDYLSKYIDAMVSQTKSKLPLQFNEYAELVKINKVNDYTVAKDIRYISYTKEEVLADYGNNVALLKQDILNAELQLSCLHDDMKKLLDLGLVTEINYFGKNNRSIIGIRIDHKACEPYDPGQKSS